MIEFVRNIFASNFMPHGMCYLWNPGVLWLNVISDGLIALSYYAIPVLLLRFFRQRLDISFRWVFVAFAAFILACGTTHLMGIWTVWHGTYWLDGGIKALTAVASLATAALLVPLLPALVKLPSPMQLRRAQEDLRGLNQELEQRVAERTAELQRSAQSLERANRELVQEMDKRAAIESQLLQSQKMEAIGRLAGGVAHDFNNLLTVISGYNEMLLEDPATPELARTYAGEVHDASGRAATLVHQLLAFGRRQVVQPRILDLNGVVRQMGRLLRRVLREDIDLSTELDASLGTIRADPTQIDQVILNIAVNARDAMPKGGRVTICTADALVTEEQTGIRGGLTPGRYAALSIADTGQGMSEEVRQHVFEPFFTTKELGKGSGLGLSIVYGIVKQNGGDVHLESLEGRGTTFTIYWPVEVEIPIATVPKVVSEAPHALGNETILVVEDEETVRTLIKKMLGQQGYTVLASQDAEGAAQLCREYPGPVHLMLTDVVMPGLSGPDLAQRLKSLRPEMKVLYMSGYADSAVARHQIGPGTPFIEKPFLPHALRRKVHDLLGSDTGA